MKYKAEGKKNDKGFCRKNIKRRRNLRRSIRRNPRNKIRRQSMRRIRLKAYEIREGKE